MELLTHAFIGAAIGEMLLGKHLGNRALAWGAAAGLLPSLDWLVMPFLDTANQLWWQRGPSHSILVAMAASILLAKPLAEKWKREKISRAQAGTFVFATLLTHLLLDCMGAIGVAVLWPLPLDRVAFGMLSPSDPLVILPLLICIPWLAFLRNKKEQPKRRRILIRGLALTISYLAFAVGMKFTADAGFRSDLATHRADGERRIVIPTASNALVWRAVVDRDQEVWVGHRSVFQRYSSSVRWVAYPRGDIAAGSWADEREVARIKSFSDGFWIARSHKRGLWIADIRAGTACDLGAHGKHAEFRMLRAWNFEPEAPKDRLIPSHADAPGVVSSLRKAGWWIRGHDPVELLPPRLAGVPGRFPEMLPVVE
ncbi:MAG: metal-dependent hydrolase [Luteolibacter sp.]